MRKGCGVGLRLFESVLVLSRIESEVIDLEEAPRVRFCSLVNVEDRKSWGKDSYHGSSGCVTQIMTGVFGTFVRNKYVVQFIQPPAPDYRGRRQYWILPSPTFECLDIRTIA
jgi:hypothetical protein